MSDRISHDEFRKTLFKLREGGSFSHQELDEVKNVFHGDLSESGSSAGISGDELKRGLHYLRHHPEEHHLSHEEIKKLEKNLKHYL